MSEALLRGFAARTQRGDAGLCGARATSRPRLVSAWSRRVRDDARRSVIFLPHFLKNKITMRWHICSNAAMPKYSFFLGNPHRYVDRPIWSCDDRRTGDRRDTCALRAPPAGGAAEARLDGVRGAYEARTRRVRRSCAAHSLRGESRWHCVEHCERCGERCVSTGTKTFLKKNLNAVDKDC